jgi:hypothetical protein
MKTLEEKKLLVKMARAFGQPVDQALIESIEREEKLSAALFNESKKEPEITGYKTGTTFLNRIPILQEDVLIEVAPEEKPAETNIQPPEEYKVQQVANYLDTVSKAKKPPLVTALQDNEFEALRKTVHDLLQKVNTLSWGGGGTGAVRINDQDDFDRTSYSEGRYLRWKNGMFRLDEINTSAVVYNTTLVTGPVYVVQDEDYYIGVNYAGPVTILVPETSDSGRTIMIKDESGNCSSNNITVDGTIDNDPGGFILAIDNGAIQLLFRNGWRII